MTDWRLLVGDCRVVLADLDAASIDAVVTDPPYGLEFMGKDWDAPWKHGFSATGYSDGSERPPRPNYGSTRNPVCRTCRKHQRGTDRCACATPNFDERPADSNRAFQEWVETWALELLRVLKPGGHALVFGGTRTYHRLASGLEDAGFEIRDCIAWMYGSGFPKSLDVAKAVDGHLGAEGTLGALKSPRAGLNLEGAVPASRGEGWDRPWKDDPEAVERNARVYEPGSEEGRQWVGWGTALKPAYEPVVVARKPLAGTVAATVLAHGTGALNIDGCRVAMSDADAAAIDAKHAGMDPETYERAPGAALRLSTDPIGLKPAAAHSLGRWPANVALGHSEGCVRVGETTIASDGHWPGARPAGSDLAGAAGHGGQDGLDERHAAGERVAVWDCTPDCPVRLLDEQTGTLALAGNTPDSQRAAKEARGELRPSHGTVGFTAGVNAPSVVYNDVGGASRFFYSAKTSRAERNAGLDAFEEHESGLRDAGRFHSGGRTLVDGEWKETGSEPQPKQNHHPTVKPIALMRWLVRLVTPPGGIILDPFTGSGTTGIAALLEGFSFVGAEQSPDYAAIAEARIRYWAEHGEDALRIAAAAERSERVRREREEAGQLDLFAEQG